MPVNWAAVKCSAFFGGFFCVLVAFCVYLVRDECSTSEKNTLNDSIPVRERTVKSLKDKSYKLRFVLFNNKCT